MSPNVGFAVTMVLAGIGIPILAAMNAALGQKIGNPFATGVVLFSVALLIGIVAAFLTGPGALANIASAPKHLLLAGVFVAFYVLSITYVAPRFGVGNAVFFVLLGQMLSAAVIDQFGLFGARIAPMTPSRLLGLVVMAIGIWLTQRK